MTKRLLSALVLSAGLLASVSAQPAFAAPTSCQLLTRSDVAAVLHVTPPNSYRNETGEVDVCLYSGTASLNVGTGDQAKYNAIMQNQAQYAPVTPISGIGERAAFTGRNHILRAYAKGYIIAIYVFTTMTHKKEAEKASALRAISRL